MDTGTIWLSEIDLSTFWSRDQDMEVLHRFRRDFVIFDISSLVSFIFPTHSELRSAAFIAKPFSQSKIRRSGLRKNISLLSLLIFY